MNDPTAFGTRGRELEVDRTEPGAPDDPILGDVGPGRLADTQARE